MCLARTLVTGPDALLMDEPTSALDPEARHGLERTARRLADAGRPLVWVTHDLAQADRLADHMVVMVGGHVAGDEERARFIAGARDGDDGRGCGRSRRRDGAAAAGEAGGEGEDARG
jgi:ABC-type polar amino acid transport system ATPase subunit